MSVFRLSRSVVLPFEASIAFTEDASLEECYRFKGAMIARREHSVDFHYRKNVLFLVYEYGIGNIF